jgi:hypothetical protein
MHKLIRAKIIGLRSALLAATVSLVSTASPIAAQQPASESCRPSGTVVEVKGLPEMSGLAVSRRVSGRLWALNDSGQPLLFALDSRGSVTGQVRLTGAEVEDWEAIAVGPCGTRSCIYVADIGDNYAGRSRVSIYRLPEPEASGGTAAVADVFHATYPDGPQDAEALLVAGDGRLHIVTKGETGPISVYRFPAELKSGAPMRLERVGTPSAKPDAAARITDAAVSPDGQWAALRTKSSVTFYRASDLLEGHWRAATRVDLTPLKEPQGEGIALGDNDVVFLAGEGGGKGRAGTFAHFACTPRL